MSLILLGILNSQVTAAGGGPAYDFIQTANPTGNSVEFTGLSSLSDYKHLQIRYAARDADFANSIQIYMQFNSASSGYSYHKIYGTGSTIQSGGTNSASFIEIGQIIGDAQPSPVFSAGVIDILDFSSTTRSKSVRLFSERFYDSWATGEQSLRGGLFDSTAAITSIKIYLNASHSFASGSRVSLYGIRG